MNQPDDKGQSTKKARTKYGYRCSICRRLYPSPEAGAAHLGKKHEGGGYLSYYARMK